MPRRAAIPPRTRQTKANIVVLLGFYEMNRLRALRPHLGGFFCATGLPETRSAMRSVRVVGVPARLLTTLIVGSPMSNRRSLVIIPEFRFPTRAAQNKFNLHCNLIPAFPVRI